MAQRLPLAVGPMRAPLRGGRLKARMRALPSVEMTRIRFSKPKVASL
jgi:hypothetical protein